MNATQQELNCLKKLMEQKNPELLIRLTAKHFGNVELGKLYQLIKRHYLEFGQFPGFDTLRATVAKACTTADKVKMMSSLLDQISERDVAGLTDDALVTELVNVSKCRLVLDRLEEITRAAEDKDTEKVLATFSDAYREVFFEEQQEEDDSDMATMSGKRITFNFNKTGISKIDERGGLIEKGYTVLAGEAKQGKSFMASQFAIYNYLYEGESVAYFSYEMPKSQIRARVLSYISDVNLSDLTDEEKELSPEQKLVQRKSEVKYFCKGGEEIDRFCLENASLEEQEFFDKVYTTFPRRKNTFRIYDEVLDWDALFIKMELLCSTKGTTFFVIDYPYLVPRGASDKNLQSWEYNMLQSKKLKQFCTKHNVRIVVPAQYDSKAESLRYAKSLINDCDLMLTIVQTKDDKELNTVTISFNACRNFKTVEGKPTLEDFKLMKSFNTAKYVDLDF